MGTPICGGSAIAVPLTFAVASWNPRTRARRGRGKARRPRFIAGFIAAAALVTYVPGLQGAGHLVSNVAKQALVLTLLLIGSELTCAAPRAAGVRPLAQGLLLWIAMAGLSLAAIIAHVIA